MSDKVFLATTALSDFWKKDQPILFLGEWCLRYNHRYEYEGLSYKILEYPWDDRNALYKAGVYCDHVYEKLLKALSEYMNNIHKVKHNLRYWRIILGPWLYHYVQSLYDRYICLRNALDHYPHIETLFLAEESYVTPTDFQHFIELLSEDLYNQQIYSQLFRLMGYQFSSLPCIITTKSLDNPGGNSIKKNIGSMLNMLGSWFDVILGKRYRIIMYKMYIPRYALWKLYWATNYQAWPLSIIRVLNSFHCKKNITDRKRLLDISIGFEDDFQRVIIQTLPVNLPMIYLEGYEKVQEHVSKKLDYTPKVVMSSVGWDFDEPFKFMAAELSERGSYLIGVQHGGLYGSALIAPQESHEIAIVNRYFSWGWRKNSKEESGIEPLSSLKLSLSIKRMAKSFFEKDGAILYVCTNYPRYLFRIKSTPIGPQTKYYIEWQHRFIETLPAEVRKQIIVRLYPHDYGWGCSQRLSDKFPDIRQDDHSIPFLERTNHSKLVICDNNETTYLETLALNIPCILFWDNNLWEMREKAIPYFNKLRNANILFDTPEDAANKVIEIYNNPHIWWLSKEIQLAREEFVNRFAFRSEDWLEVWVDKLQSYCGKDKVDK